MSICSEIRLTHCFTIKIRDMGFAFYCILIQFMYLFLRQGLFKNYFIFLSNL
jgi:hypothetical protein